MTEDTQVIGSDDVGTGSAEGIGEAHDASVSVVETPPENKVARLERELREAREEDEAQFPQRRVEAAERAVEKAKAQLAGAEAALRQAHEDNEREAEEQARLKAEAEAAATDEAQPIEGEAASTTEG